MKIKLLACLFIYSILSTIPATTTAQELKVGDEVISLGIGFGSSFNGYSTSSQSPAISFQYERGQWAAGGPGTVSIGGFLGFKSFKYAYTSHYSEKWNYTIIGIRSAYHYSGLDVPHLDVYGGAMLSYNIISYTFQSNDPDYDYYENDEPNTLGFALYAGGKYYFSNNVAGFLELSYGISYLTIGGSYKF